MATTTFLEKVPVFQKWSLRVVLPTGLGLLVLGFFTSLWLVLLGVLLTLIAITFLCMWVVPTGNIGYIEVFQEVKPKTYHPGLNWYIPVITDRYLMNTRLIEYVRIDKKKIIEGTDIIFNETFNYRLKKDKVHKVFQMMSANYWQTVEKWVDAAIDGVTSKFTYAEIRTDLDGFKQMIAKAIQSAVEKKCRELTAKEYATKETVTLYRLEPVFERIIDPNQPTIQVVDTNVPTKKIVDPNQPTIKVVDPRDPSKVIEVPNLITVPNMVTIPNYITVPVMVKIEEGGKEETVQKKEMVEYQETLQGINFFDLLTITINDVMYPKSYQDARDQFVTARVEVGTAQETAKKWEIQAEGKAKALSIQAKGEAEAIKAKGEAEAAALEAKGEAENRVMEERGRVLADNPELISQEVAKNYPTVVGGAMPTLGIDDIVNRRRVSGTNPTNSSTTTTNQSAVFKREGNRPTHQRQNVSQSQKGEKKPSSSPQKKTETKTEGK